MARPDPDCERCKLLEAQIAQLKILNESESQMFQLENMDLRYRLSAFVTEDVE